MPWFSCKVVRAGIAADDNTVYIGLELTDGEVYNVWQVGTWRWAYAPIARGGKEILATALAAKAQGSAVTVSMPQPVADWNQYTQIDRLYCI